MYHCNICHSTYQQSSSDQQDLDSNHSQYTQLSSFPLEPDIGYSCRTPLNPLQCQCNSPEIHVVGQEVDHSQLHRGCMFKLQANSVPPNLNYINTQVSLAPRKQSLGHTVRACGKFPWVTCLLLCYTKTRKQLQHHGVSLNKQHTKLLIVMVHKPMADSNRDPRCGLPGGPQSTYCTKHLFECSSSPNLNQSPVYGHDSLFYSTPTHRHVHYCHSKPAPILIPSRQKCN